MESNHPDFAIDGSVFIEPAKLSAMTSTMKSVYILESENGMIKIGVSHEFQRRKRAIETQSGFCMRREACSIPLQNACEIESKAHKYFKPYAVLDEWFTVSFSDACRYVENLIRKIGDTTPQPEIDKEGIERFVRTLVFGSDTIIEPGTDSEEGAMQEILHSYPGMYKYMQKNRIQAYYDEQGILKVYMFTDEGERVDMSYNLFVATTLYGNDCEFPDCDSDE